MSTKFVAVAACVRNSSLTLSKKLKWRCWWKLRTVGRDFQLISKALWKVLILTYLLLLTNAGGFLLRSHVAINCCNWLYSLELLRQAQAKDAIRGIKLTGKQPAAIEIPHWVHSTTTRLHYYFVGRTNYDLSFVMITIIVACYSWAPSGGDHLSTCGAIYRPPHNRLLPSSNIFRVCLLCLAILSIYTVTEVLPSCLQLWNSIYYFEE